MSIRIVKWFTFSLLLILLASCSEKNDIFPPVSWGTYFYEKSDIPARPISALLIENQQSEWYGSLGKEGLIHFDGYDWTILNAANTGIEFDSVTSIVRDGNGNLWVGWKSGLAMYNGTTWNEIQEFKGWLISGIVTQGIGIVWVSMDGNAAQGGLARYEAGTWTFLNPANSPIPSSHIRCMLISPEQAIWLGTANAGLISYRSGSWNVYGTQETGFKDAAFTCLAMDEDGTVWAGTAKSQLMKVSNGISSILETGATSAPTGIATITGGGLYITTAGSGILGFKDGVWSSYTSENAHFPANGFQFISRHSDGNYLTACQDGHVLYFKTLGNN